LYYARLYSELEGPLDGIEHHLFDPDGFLSDEAVDIEEQRCGLALSVLGHLAGYGRRDALHLLRRYVCVGGAWEWALDELAVRDDDEGLRALGPAVLTRFPRTEEGEARLAAALKDAYEPRPWRLWAEDGVDPATAARVRKASERTSFDRWQRQMRPIGPTPGWSVRAVLEWAQQGLDAYPAQFRDAPAARCLAAVVGPEDRPELVEAARRGPAAARAAALRHLADRQDPEALDLIEAAMEGADGASETVARAALESFERMRSVGALARARAWSGRDDVLGAAAARMLACRGGAQDTDRVLAALRRLVQREGADADGLAVLVEGTGRLRLGCAAPVLRHIYRETASSQLRGIAAQALAATDPSFPAGFAVECLWDCEEITRGLAARHATTGDVRVLAQLRRLAADPAEEAEVQTAVLGRLSSSESAR
jgi:hypothetical protein